MKAPAHLGGGVGLALALVLLTGCTGEQSPSLPAGPVVQPGDTPAASPSALLSAVSPPSPANSPPPAAAPAPTASAPVPAPTGAQEPPSPAGSPAALAARVVQAERAIRSDDTDDAALANAGRLQQAAYRELAARPQWRQAVLEAVPADLRSVVVAHTDAIRDLLKLTRPQAKLPAWRIVAPPPPAELLGYYREAEQEFGVGWEYLAAIHLSETRMGRIRGTSPAGARGPMQFMPGTWDAYGRGDIDDPRDAVMAAGRYLRASGAPANMRGALFAYNRSEAYVRAITVHAEQMRADPRTYRGYWHWQVYYRTVDGDRLLPVGYDGAA
ncbi:MAG: transglycosylase SLT domain-containing protein [Actinobacteria bacterium]|nr:transglycosylase SLT domain-containing protein [Actinomycetota bacterium]